MSSKSFSVTFLFSLPIFGLVIFGFIQREWRVMHRTDILVRYYEVHPACARLRYKSSCIYHTIPHRSLRYVTLRFVSFRFVIIPYPA